MKTYKLHLIRHGLTQGNREGTFVGGGLDIPLCRQGEEDLRALAARFPYPNVPLVFSSPMKRALQTAELLYPEVKEKVIIEQLRENRFGEFEGKTMTELRDNRDFAAWLDPKSGYVPKGGESGENFAKRTAGALMAMMQHLARQGIPQAACITHGGVIMSMLAQKGLPRKPSHQWMSDNGCGFTVQADAGMLMRDEMVEVVAVLPEGYLGGHGEEIARRYIHPGEDT
ncbi:histidine phosphatase family protein [Ruminococcaceae bacterium OttesenSCG-928-I18]|nr:histidine phosphatase family protein [Ruminococcaceae bacterium OttesenSCG-928-I18]